MRNEFGLGGNGLRIVSIDEGFEQTFWDYVDQDPLDYYFFILDWKNRKEQTKILLALEGRKVKGLMLLYAEHIVQLRGDRKSVETLLEHVGFDSVELQAPLDCEDLVLRKYKADFRHELVLMRLNRGEENIQIKNTPRKLGPEDVEQVAEVLRNADPVVWGDLDVEKQRLVRPDTFLTGIRCGNKLVSVGLTRFVDFASNIGAIATDVRYRNRGYATSIVSALVREILKKSPIAIIHVLADNAPAVCAYSKVGFKPYKRYLMIMGKKIGT